MLRLLRRRMLTALMETPAVVYEPLSWAEYIHAYAVSIAVLGFNLFAIQWGYRFAETQWQLSIPATTTLFMSCSFAITAGLYIYNVYVVNWLSGNSGSHSNNNNNNNKED